MKSTTRPRYLRNIKSYSIRNNSIKNNNNALNYNDNNSTYHQWTTHYEIKGTSGQRLLYAQTSTMGNPLKQDRDEVPLLRSPLLLLLLPLLLIIVQSNVRWRWSCSAIINEQNSKAKLLPQPLQHRFLKLTIPLLFLLLYLFTLHLLSLILPQPHLPLLLLLLHQSSARWKSSYSTTKRRRECAYRPSGAAATISTWKWRASWRRLTSIGEEAAPLQQPAPFVAVPVEWIGRRRGGNIAPGFLMMVTAAPREFAASFFRVQERRRGWSAAGAKRRRFRIWRRRVTPKQPRKTWCYKCPAALFVTEDQVLRRRR